MVRLLLGLAVCVAALAAPAGAQDGASDAEVRAILAQRIDVHRRGVGIVVGLVDRSGRRLVAYGSAGKEGARRLDGDTLFEIGSITKVFTALLLADMAHRGEVGLDDPVAKHLPAEVRVPQRDGRAITLADLATHTSGLPRMPANFRSQDLSNPFADYTVARLYEYLGALELTRAVGGRYEYSNTGFGLLGHALERRAGTDYEALLHARICTPLGLDSTRIGLSPEQRARLATGHDVDLSPVANWDFAVLAATGALRSSTNDMLALLAANLGLAPSPLAEPMRAMSAEKRPAGGFFFDSALGWTVDTRGGGEIVWKDGATGGYRAFIGTSAKAQRGVAVLANAVFDINDIGLHLLDARFRLAAPPGYPKEVAVSAATLEGYVGRYELRPKVVFAVTREDDRLFAQLTGQLRFRLYPMSERRFFYKVVESDIAFETDEQGRAVALMQHQNGASTRAKRLDLDAAKPAEQTAK